MKTTRFLSLVAIFAVSFTFFACSTDDSSSGSSDSSQKVYCKLTSGTCSQMSLTTCLELVNAGQALVVPDCSTDPVPSSSSNNGRSSSSNPNGGKSLVKKSFTLSYAGKSYGDLDAGQIYGQSELSSKKGDIDIVAYYASGVADAIQNPCYVATIGDECSLLVTLYNIPSKYHSQLATGETTEDIKDFLDAFVADEIDTDANEADEISISRGSAFLVLSSKGKYFIVVIKDTGAQTVSLEFSGNAFEK